MTEDIVEIVGIALVIAGGIAIVVGAAFISVALACLVGGFLGALAGVLVIVIANRSAAAKKATPTRPGG